MKEYIVIKDILNIRSTATDADDTNFMGQLLKGETLYLLDDEIIGVMPKGGTTNKWKRDPNNRLVSLDGVRLKTYEDRKAEFLARTDLEHLHHGFDQESQWSVTWGFVNLEIWKIWETYQTKGAGIKVAIIDTGLNSSLPEFNSKASTSYFNALSTSARQQDCMDQVGHGTDCAAYLCAGGPDLFGIAPEIELLVIKASDGSGNFDQQAIIKGFEHAIGAGVNVISISIGIDEDDPSLKDLHAQVQAAVKQGITVCAAIGDDSSSIAIAEYPASFVECLSVGATNVTDKRSDSSAISDLLKISAPGEEFKSLFKPGIKGSGSSFAAPIVAGAIALLKSVAMKKSEPLPNDQVLNILQHTARNDFSNYNSREFGWGIIDINAAFNFSPNT